MLRDLRFGLKLLWKEKAFSITALVTLALCIGANTAIFTVLSAVVLNPLPFFEPGRLVTMYNIYPGVGFTDRGSNGTPDYLDRRKLTDIFDSVALIGHGGYDLGAQGSAQRIDGQYVTPDYFRVLRVQPALGRAFTEEEGVPGKDNVAILSHGLWKDLYGKDPGAVGKDIRLSGVQRRVVGVMPEGFGTNLGGDTIRVWVPFALTDRQRSDEARHNNSWDMLGRLKPGVSVAQAQQRIDALNKHNIERFPQYRKLLEDARFATKVVPAKDELTRDIRPTLYLLQTAVVVVLLIGCVNVANLMLVRSNIRIKELAIRFSLGAGRMRLARQLLTESIAVALCGGAAGVAVGFGGVRLLSWLGAAKLPRGADLHLDIHALAFSAIVAVLTGIVFGLVPVLHLFRHNLNDTFRQTERGGTAQRRAVWTRSALVITQVSLAFVLLIGAGLMTLSFSRVLSVNPGFHADGVLSARISLPGTRYGDDARASAFYDRLMEGLRAIPGVRSAGATTFLPFGGSQNASVISIDGYTRAPGENPPVPGWNRVDSGYLATMGIPLLKGRGLTDADGHDAPKVALIDEFLAGKYWPKRSPIGAKIRDGLESDKDNSLWTVIGVVGNVKRGDLAERTSLGQVYFHYRQKIASEMHIVVRAATGDPQVVSAIRRELRKADPELPLFDVMNMPERISESLLNRRAAVVICLIFAGLALLLSAVGIYGVLAYTVTQRTREFGIRVALGASARDVLGMVVGQGLKLAGIGLAIGIVAALALTRLMANMLYEVKPADPGVFLAIAAVLAAVAMLASLVPSLRALRIKPASALRYE